MQRQCILYGPKICYFSLKVNVDVAVDIGPRRPNYICICELKIENHTDFYFYCQINPNYQSTQLERFSPTFPQQSPVKGNTRMIGLQELWINSKPVPFYLIRSHAESGGWNVVCNAECSALLIQHIHPAAARQRDRREIWGAGNMESWGRNCFMYNEAALYDREPKTEGPILAVSEMTLRAWVHVESTGPLGTNMLHQTG